MRVSKIGLILVLAACGLLLWWSVAEGPLRNPSDALAEFYEARYRAEDQVIDPLILNGRRVVPLVLAELPNRNMPRRRYAIGFLGNGRYEKALPVLEQILADESEISFFRADALAAIQAISSERASALASAFTEGESDLSRIATRIASGESVHWSERSFWEALLHAHE